MVVNQPLRTLLFVPGNKARMLHKARTLPADADGLRAEAQEARHLGYSGKLVIHPAQIEPVHRAFAPGAGEVAHARRVLEAFEAAQSRGDGVIALDGQMIDAPVVARAREVLALAGGMLAQDAEPERATRDAL